MIIKTCVDCGAVILSNNVTARRCPVCAERFAERVRKKYKNPPADPLTADVRKADAAGKSYGYWRLDELLKEQKAWRVPPARHADHAVLPPVQRPPEVPADAAAQAEERAKSEMNLIILVAVLAGTLVLAGILTALLYWVKVITEFGMGVVALVWLILLLGGVLIGGRDPRD